MQPFLTQNDNKNQHTGCYLLPEKHASAHVILTRKSASFGFHLSQMTGMSAFASKPSSDIFRDTY